MNFNVVQNRWVQLASVGAAAFAGGLGLGYILGKRNGDVFEVTVSEEELQLNIFDHTPEYEDMMETLAAEDNVIALREDIAAEKARQEALRAVQAEEIKAAEAEVIERKNIFDGHEDSWDYEAELSVRDGEMPYVIHLDEFANDEMGFRQETVTFYAGDNIMADAADVPIYGFESMMGDLKFGHGSNDKNVVYVRNEKMKMEWEVLYHDGAYEIEVLGYEMEKEIEEGELRHSVQKFRPE